MAAVTLLTHEHGAAAGGVCITDALAFDCLRLLCYITQGPTLCGRGVKYAFVLRETAGGMAEFLVAREDGVLFMMNPSSHTYGTGSPRHGMRDVLEGADALAFTQHAPTATIHWQRLPLSGPLA